MTWLTPRFYIKFQPLQLTHQICLQAKKYLHFGVNILESLFITIIVLVNFKGCNQVHDLILVSNRVDPPIFDDEGQLVHLFLSLLIKFVAFKYISHDGNEHVEQMDTHEEAHQCEQDHQRWSHAVVQVKVSVELPQRGKVDVVKRPQVSAVRWDRVNVALCYLLLVTADTVEGIHEGDRSDYVDRHEMADLIDYRKDDIDQWGDFSNKPQKVKNLKHHNNTQSSFIYPESNNIKLEYE